MIGELEGYLFFLVVHENPYILLGKRPGQILFQFVWYIVESIKRIPQ